MYSGMDILTKTKCLIEKIENSSAGPTSLLVSILSIIFLRSFMEGMNDSSHFILEPIDYFVFIPLAYFAIFFALFIILRLVTKQDSLKLLRIMSVFWVLILLPPILDPAIAPGTSIEYKYLKDGGLPALTGCILTFCSNDDVISTGIRIEVMLVMIFSAIYVYFNSKKLYKTVLTPLIIYIIIGLWGSTPLILDEIFVPLFGPTYFEELELVNAHITTMAPLLLIPAYTIVIALELLVIIFLWNRKKAIAILKNISVLRTAHYLLAAMFGLMLGTLTINSIVQASLVLRIVPLLFSVFFAFQCCVYINDYFDIKSDSVSNKKKPLVKGVLDPRESLILAVISAVLSLLLAFSLGYYVLLSILIAMVLGIMYSAPPLALRRWPLLSTFTLALCTLFAGTAGFALIVNEQLFELMNQQIVLLTIVGITLGANFKDIRDVKGDKKAGYYTIPVLLGEKKGRRVISVLVALSFLLVPFIVGHYSLILPSAIAALFNLWLFNSRYYKDTYFLSTYILYFLLLILLSASFF